MTKKAPNSSTTRQLTVLRIVIVIVLPLLSGAAALSHELLWTRRLVDILGATDWVIGRVLGMFFLGLSLGGYLSHRFQAGKRNTLVRLAATEVLIAILALPAAFLPFWTDWIWSTIGTDALVSWQGSVIKVLLASMVVLPPAIAMGFTLPLFVRAATNLGGTVSSIGIWTYSFNTLGGVAGLWVTSSYLIDFLGAQGTMLTVSALNVVIAIAALLLSGTVRVFKGDSSTSLDLPDIDQIKGKAVSARQFSRLTLVALSFFSGLVVLAIEVFVFRLMALVVPTSHHTTSALLANVILLLAISSILVSLLNRFLNPNRWTLLVGLAGAAAFCCYCPSILYHQTDQLISLRYLQGLNGQVIESIDQYWILLFSLIASTSGFTLFFVGLVFPAILTLASLDDPNGDGIGLLLAANGIGGLVGSELANSVVMPVFGIYFGFIVLAAVLAVIAISVALPVNRSLVIGMAATFLLLFSIGYYSSAELPYISPRSTTKYDVESTTFGREGVLLVVNDSRQSKSILMNNQYVLGSSGVATDERRQLLLPWLLHPSAESVCSLGLATGIAASGLEGLDRPPTVTAVELSVNVAELAKQHFQSETNGFFDRKDNSIAIEDARVYIASAVNRFDIIVGDLFRPHGAGEGRLYSLEHFRNIRNALTDQGLFCQWLPVYQLNQENFEVIAATFQRVFPSTLVVFGNANSNVPVVGLFAWKNGQDWREIDLLDRLNQIDPDVVASDRLLEHAPGMVVGVLKQNAYSNSPVNTLDNMFVEISAGNFMILKDLRKNRTRSDPRREYLSGAGLPGFLNRLDGKTESLIPREYRQPIIQMLNVRR